MITVDIERATKRREAMLRRLASAAGRDFSTDTATNVPAGACPRSASWTHSAPNWLGRCNFCGQFISRLAQARTAKQIDIDIEDVIDETTLSPVDACERSDTLIEQYQARAHEAAKPWRT